MDTIIGTSGGKGDKCFLTLLFRQYNLMLIYLLPYKQSSYITLVFNYLKEFLGIDGFKVILNDNGTEFSDPESIEVDFNTGEIISNVFYCNPNCFWQKGSIEKNHEYIRHILPYEASINLIGKENLDKLKIDNINYDDIDLTIKLLKK